ncbi:MAG: tRNA (N6-threonylcarbamoyladenosine(37)-N6)-methyltransferase TrmO [Polyangiales bacterium]
MHAPLPSVSILPIGVVRSPFLERADAPRQPRADGAVREAEGEVVLFAGRGYEDALTDLSAWDYVWLVVWFHHNQGFRPKVSPPRSAVRRGVFATRAPYRPNPIGLSAVRLLAVEGLTLRVRGLDLLDGTPVLDVKPYVPYTDAIADAGHGWLDDAPPPALAPGTLPADPRPAFTISFAPHAAAQLAYLRDAHAVDLAARIEAQLALGVTPHAYRRIKKDGPRFRLALKDWRVWFEVEGRAATVVAIGSGYRPRELFGEAGQAPEAHRAFAARWPTPPG